MTSFEQLMKKRENLREEISKTENEIRQINANLAELQKQIEKDVEDGNEKHVADLIDEQEKLEKQRKTLQTILVVKRNKNKVTAEEITGVANGEIDRMNLDILKQDEKIKKAIKELYTAYMTGVQLRKKALEMKVDFEFLFRETTNAEPRFKSIAVISDLGEDFFANIPEINKFDREKYAVAYSSEHVVV